MEWLKYSDSEVTRFHPAFESIAKSSLSELGLETELEWVHHDTTASGGIPDYVLRYKSSNKWLLVVEIKKTKSAVLSSTQYRRQVYSYVSENKHRFRSKAPFLYCLTNLEVTQLFGANDIVDLSSSPNTRQLDNWVHGDFNKTDVELHKSNIKVHLMELIRFSVDAKRPLQYKINFSESWSAIQELSLPIGYDLPSTWDGIEFSSWFSTVDKRKARSMLFAARCLLAEWVVYQSEKHDHVEKRKIIRIKSQRSDSKNTKHLADVIGRILQIDFEDIFGCFTPSELSSLTSKQAQSAITAIINELETLPIEQLADLVGHSGLPDLLFEELQEQCKRSRRGTVQTDPELAYAAASIGVYGYNHLISILDPCCGIGNLLTAAYQAREGKFSHSENITSLNAIEIDPLQSTLSALQLIMQSPKDASKLNRPNIICDSMFNHSDLIEGSDLVIMNPPYKRYENDEDPLPEGYRNHLVSSISQLRKKAPETINGQPDLYNYYVEFVISAMKKGARGVFILNNKWMNTKTTSHLRKFLVNHCAINALIVYPQRSLFKGHLIATSILVFTKSIEDENSDVHYVRCLDDLRDISIDDIVNASFYGSSSKNVQSSVISFNELKKHTLNDKVGSWRQFLPLPNCLNLLSVYPRLVDLFESTIGGRLERDEVSKVLSFPIRNWKEKGTSVRGSTSLKFAPGSKRESAKGAPVSDDILNKITQSASIIPNEYRGFALKNAHNLGPSAGFRITENSLIELRDSSPADSIIEPPELKYTAWSRGPKKAKWGTIFEESLDRMRKHPDIKEFVSLIENDLGLNYRPSSIVWEDFLRPCAGELILVRNFRAGWRAHLNELAFFSEGPQLRISSNFYSLRGVSTSDGFNKCASAKEAASVLVAFLLSTFGQIQLETFGDLREGTRKCEKSCIEKIHAPHPATVSEEIRKAMINLIDQITYPIDCENHPHTDAKRFELDCLVAAHMLKLAPIDPRVIEVVENAAEELDELLCERCA
ncbi:BpuSI family type II restriction endonuclease [Vibrio parahaemolyticus]|nr:BpuSI family type II restriction endonuclease [Vibrio parahaemolyticus]